MQREGSQGDRIASSLCGHGERGIALNATLGFLFSSHQLLEGRRPIDVAIENELSGQFVKNLLGALQYGSAV